MAPRWLTAFGSTLACLTLAACTHQTPAPPTGGADGATSGGTTRQVAIAPIDEIKDAPSTYAVQADDDGWTTTTMNRGRGAGDDGSKLSHDRRFRGKALGRGGAAAPGGAAPRPPAKAPVDGPDSSGAPEPDAEVARDDTAEGGERLRRVSEKLAKSEGRPDKASDKASDAAPAEGRKIRRPAATDQQALPKLKAGEVDDNVRWDEFLTYHRDNARVLPESYRLDVTERYIVEVVDGAGRALPGARVGVAGNDQLLLEARTVSNGRALFFPRTVPEAKDVTSFDVTVQYGDVTEVVSFPRKKHGADKPWQITLDVAKQIDQVQLDLLFLLDTTGSMSDEIRRVQATLLQITKRIRELDSKPSIRYGMVLYRDRGDAYVTRRFGFTGDVASFDKALKQVGADGGGDGPEAMNMGLFTAVDQMPWSEDSLRLMFLVADAQPHMDYEDDVPYTRTLRSAVAKGIKIFPTAASGLGQTGTYVMRQVAQFTQGRFLYIEYGQAGATAKKHGVEKPTTPKGSNNLDDLIVRIVRSELAEYTK